MARNQTLDKSKWQGKQLRHIEIAKVANGYTVTVSLTLPEPDPVSKSICTFDTHVFTTGAEVADFIKDCLCGDTQDEGGTA